jgi:hypothetical protein
VLAPRVQFEARLTEQRQRKPKTGITDHGGIDQQARIANHPDLEKLVAEAKDGRATTLPLYGPIQRRPEMRQGHSNCRAALVNGTHIPVPI